MTMNAATVWEIRTTGSNTNGGGYANLSPGVSVDYSQQDTPVLTRADFQKGTGANDITTAAGVACFTQAMIGNIIWIVPSTIKFFQIITVSGDLKTITVDAAVGTFTGKTGNVGGAFKLGGASDTVFASSKLAENILHVKAGTYTFGGSFVVPGGTIWIGYNTTRNDNPIGVNRPVFDFGSAYRFSTVSGVNYLHNLIFTGSFSSVVYDAEIFAYNCKFSNTNTSTTGYVAVQCDGSFIHCEFSSVKGTCIAGQTVYADYCYFHDGNTGILVSAFCVVKGCVFKNFTIPATLPQAGIDLNGSSSLVHVFGCVFYSCSNGIVNTVGLAYDTNVVNNIFDACGTGISWYATAAANNIFDYNCYHCSVADVFNISKGAHDITADPLFMFPLTNDFRLSVGSPCFNTGMQLGSIVGL